MTGVVAVVDDDPRVLESLENLLESAGYAVRLFSSAVALLDRTDLSELDCLITDIGLPGMDGLDLQRLIYRTRPSLPVILITGRDLPDDVLASVEGSHAYFRKPFDGQRLLLAVGEAVVGNGGEA